MSANGHVVRLEIQSSFDMLDFVQLVCDRIGQMARVDEDNLHWIGVAVRESVINGIKHGNREVPSASAARMAYRCEIDLSPGGRTTPVMRRAGSTTSVRACGIRGTIAPSCGALRAAPDGP